MDKKSILAMILIAIVILTLPYYQQFIRGDKPVQRPVVSNVDTTENIKTTDEPVITQQKDDRLNKLVTEDQMPAEQPENALSVQQDSSEKEIVIDSDLIRVVLSNRGGGSLKEFILKNYEKYDSSLVNMIDPKISNDLVLRYQDNNGNFVDPDNYLFKSSTNLRKMTLNPGEQFKIDYLVQVNGNQIRKSYIFYGHKYHFDVVVHFSNPDQMLLNRQYEFGWENGLPSTESYVVDDNNYNQAYVYMADELENYSVSDAGEKDPVSLTGRASWLAIRTKYFITSIINRNADVSDGVTLSGQGIKREEYVQRLYDVTYNVRYENITSGDTMRVYLGPLDHRELGQYENDLDVLIMNNGWYERTFRFFSLLILPFLEFLNSFIPNYGIVIIIFSVLVKLVLYPLTKKSYTSMREMQRIQPLMTELREKYKSDPQRLNKEMMKLYKQHGVNPMGGCLPMLLQMPLLIALFIVFRSTIQLRGASFIPGWIDDLSRTDTLFTLPFSLPMYGDQFNLLPILMALTMIFQSKMTMQDPKQKMMVYIMPIFMLLIFNRFPAGLNLYYTMFNLLTIIQQKFMTGKESGPVALSDKSKSKKTKN